ncbi:hypothetical protein ACFRMN_06340 [Streptomyces sp. NPDC056835]|uniref:hypothetical protein n=1 Tax=Streptomyces sp. NPDC056835 TaxID=3345956 RepID=UPI0036894489
MVPILAEVRANSASSARSGRRGQAGVLDLVMDGPRAGARATVPPHATGPAG